DRHHADSVCGQLVQDAVDQEGSVPVTAPGRVDGHPQDLSTARRFARGQYEAHDRAGFDEDPAEMAGGVLADLIRDIAGEVVRQAFDDGRDGRNVPSGQAADGEHGVYCRPATLRLPRSVPPDSDSPEAEPGEGHGEGEVDRGLGPLEGPVAAGGLV